MPGTPWTNWIGIIFLIGVGVLLSLEESTRIALYVAPIWFGILALSYQVVRRYNKNDA
jgi:AAT family amino acid transporter/D-serine/D-alanine/glycine transporter